MNVNVAKGLHGEHICDLLTYMEERLTGQGNILYTAKSPISYKMFQMSACLS